MGPSVIAASTTLVNVTVNSMFASELGDGPTYWLFIAFRLVQLPLGLFGVALGTVALPLLSRMAVAGNFGAFRSELARGMRLAFLLTIPATIGLMMLAEPIMSVLYQHRKFTAYDAAEAAGALRFYAIGLAGYAALKVLVNAFYALEMRKIPMFVSLAAVGLNLFLNWLFTVQFGWGHRGLALSTGCIATTNFLVLYLIMRRRLTLLETRAMAAMLGKIAMASVSLIAVCWTGAHFVLADWATQPFWPKLGWLAVTIVAGASAFVACALLLRVTELEQLASGVKRRLNRRAT
jgi:putative peptidoglycan lipid II flippase